MRFTEIKSCYMGPEISPEQFIPEHFFLFLVKGSIEGFDGYRHYVMKAGEHCVVKKNHLARYSKQKDNGQFEKVVIIFDEPFLREFQHKYHISESVSGSSHAFALLKKDELVLSFIRSLIPYYNGAGKINETFSNLKREELLLILLELNPKLAIDFFDFGTPGKIDLEAYMNRNYKFNVSLDRFAYLTGRSLSSFKRDFKKIFHETPGRWLVRRRIEEAYFLISKKDKRPTDIYLDLGFEDLSHFSYAFKNVFGYSPAKLSKKSHISGSQKAH